MLAVVMMLLSSGCSLAVEDAGEDAGEVVGEDAQINTDRLVGAFVTTEHLDLFDVEAYLNDNIDEIVEGGEVTVGNDSQYNGRIYATIDKKNSIEPSDWEISFEGVEGICFFNAKWQKEGEEPFSMLTVGEEICDVTQHLNVTDEGETKSITGTMYALVGENVDEVTFYLNPVYQTETGEIYVTTGVGFGMSGDIGGGYTAKHEGETTVTENGESKVYGGSVELTIEILRSAPAKVRIHYMDNNLAILHTEEYVAGEVPVSLETVEGTACVVVETEWEDGKITRELYEPKESESTYVEIFYEVSNITLGKQNTEVIWK